MRGANPFRFDGTLDRAQYLAFNLAWLALVVVTGVGTVARISASGDVTVLALSFVVAVLIGAVARLSYAVRRLRHIGWHAAWSLLAFVPMAALGLDLALVLIPGAPEGPEAGPDAPSGSGSETATAAWARAAAGALEAAEGDWRWTDAGWRRVPSDAPGSSDE